MNRHLAKAVTATFRDSTPLQHYERLTSFRAGDWRDTFHWLDSSGLALYFLQRIKSLAIDTALPRGIVLQLEQRFTDNQTRTACLFEEFVAINNAFQEAGVPYLNLKGFSLIPDYCLDLSQRYQMDCDFLVGTPANIHCLKILGDFGYLLSVATDSVMEFKAAAHRIPRMRDLYKSKPQRAVEIHLFDPKFGVAKLGLEGAAMERRRAVVLNRFTFPALSAPDMFVAQAVHLFRHVRSEWTRISWLLELRNATIANQHDELFWNNVRQIAERVPGASLGIAVALSLSVRALGDFVPQPLASWTISKLPRVIALWLDQYSEAVLLADHPGTKLYLLLERELEQKHETSSIIRKRLVPLHRPTRVASAPTGNARQRLLASSFQWRYGAFRLRFHLKESPRYLFQAWRWRRLLNRQKKHTPSEDMLSARIGECSN